MKKNSFNMQNVHISVAEDNVIIFWGKWIGGLDHELKITWNGKPQKYNIYAVDDPVRKRIFHGIDGKDYLAGKITVSDIRKKNTLIFKGITDGENVFKQKHIFSNCDLKGRIQFVFEKVLAGQEKIFFEGWAISSKQPSIKVLVPRTDVQPDIRWSGRYDILNTYPEADIDIKAGFSFCIQNTLLKNEHITMSFSAGEIEKKYSFSDKSMLRMRWYNKGGIKKRIVQIRDIEKNNGFRRGTNIVWQKIRRGAFFDYNRWIRSLEPDTSVLDKERKHTFGISPKISIVVPVFNTRSMYLVELIDSVEYQTYQNWELVFVDAGCDDNGISSNTEYIKHHLETDERIVYIPLKENKSISENTNEGIKKATGEWIAFVDHDDLISPDALYEVVKYINAHPYAGYFYSDEDKIDAHGRKRSEPVFKPDYDPDLLCSVNYISHLSVVRKSLFDEVGLLAPEYNGAQDYDLVLRCAERLKEDQIIHIPHILYHWRMAEGSTAGDESSKMYAFEAGRRAIKAHLERLGYDVSVDSMMDYLGKYRVRYHWTENPLVSVLIPNKDHIDDLDRILTSFNKTEYKNYEIIIIENNSTEPETFKYYDDISDAKIRVIYYKGDFNYPKINNFGEKEANGEYILLLNNDTEVIDGDWLTEMVSIGMRNDVGIVGAKLYYPDDTVQHAGVIVGLGGVAGHAFKYYSRNDPGYACRAILTQDYSAVTAACMLVRKSVYDEVGGISEDLAVAFNDVDFCLKVRQKGYHVVFTPFAELYHYESKSRGVEDTPEKQERFTREVNLMKSRWHEILRDGDPYYSPYLTLDSENFGLNTNMRYEDLEKTLS